MNPHFITALALHGILLGQPTTPVQQWQDMRASMAAVPFATVAKSIKIDYVNDDTPNWQTPTMTKVRRAGDCEDMVIFDYFNGQYAPLDMAAVVVGNTPNGLHAALFYAAPDVFTFKGKVKMGHTTYALKVKDRVNPRLAGNTEKYLGFFKPIYLISQDKMYLVQPMER